jgi:hypothetical protein
MKKSDAKEGVKVIFRGVERIIHMDNNKPYIKFKAKTQSFSWDYKSWVLVKSNNSLKRTTSKKNAPSSKNKKSKPTLHLNWTKHPSNDKFITHFKKLESTDVVKDKKMSTQGWYCLGSNDNIGYIGLVGKTYQPETPKKGKNKNKKPPKRQANSSFRKRWQRHDTENIKEAKFPKGFFATNKIKIKNKPARLHTASIAAARKYSSDRWMPRLVNRGVSQGTMIEEIEAFIIYHAAQTHKDLVTPKNKTKRFYKQKSKGWEGGKDNPKPYNFPSNKTMVNYLEVSKPSSAMMYDGDFNIKFSGSMPSDLEKIFSKGVYVKGVINSKEK